MNKGVHDKEETVEEKPDTAIPVESKPIYIEKHYCPVLPRPFWPLGHLSYVQSLQFFMLINVVWVHF